MCSCESDREIRDIIWTFLKALTKILEINEHRE